MKDWKKIASAYHLAVPEGDWERITPALDSLEKAFRPLVESMARPWEPATVFVAAEEETE
jgi:hypothetical protein